MPWDWCPKSSKYSQIDHCHGHDGWQMTAERNKGCVIWTKCESWRCFFSKCAFLYETKYFITISTFVFQIKDYLVFKDEWFRYFKQYLVNHILVNTSDKRKPFTYSPLNALWTSGIVIEKEEIIYFARKWFSDQSNSEKTQKWHNWRAQLSRWKEW